MAMPNTPQACHVSKQMFPQETALMTTRLCRCTTPSRHRAPKTLHNSVKHDKGRGRWGNILVARTTPAPSWRFPACGDPVAGAGPSSRSASSPRRHGPTPINTGESRSILNRGFSRRHQLQSRITAHRQQDQFTTESSRPLQSAPPGSQQQACWGQAMVLLQPCIRAGWSITPWCFSSANHGPSLFGLVCVCVQWRRRMSRC